MAFNFDPEWFAPWIYVGNSDPMKLQTGEITFIKRSPTTYAFVLCTGPDAYWRHEVPRGEFMHRISQGEGHGFIAAEIAKLRKAVWYGAKETV